MQLGIVLICWRGLAVLVPVPGKLGERLTAITLVLLLNDSNGSVLEKSMLNGSAPAPTSSRCPTLWSMKLAPGPTPLADPTLGEHILLGVVEQPVTDEPGVGAGDRHQCIGALSKSVIVNSLCHVCAISHVRTLE
jgi:hypothetical protein